ncbi:Ribosomal RNA small subunit methyltransferase E [Camellia lanceoleosa]|uniref:Ribosomal RNA small subunit methyltransferase E n=1 Tax=Camellia lanceoleosa TaxID=1840588 RepID=A0ACC0FXJ7_9ERIC|nr:Ribosomal RNA small subunit methyltransferase E [Camellia lanceoleosa]
MKTLVMGHRFTDLVLNRPWLKASSLRLFSSSSSSSLDYSNQSRGGLPRFFSEVLPPSKAFASRFNTFWVVVFVIQGDEFWHMTKVLRLSARDRVELFNGKGGLIEGCIERIDRTGLDFMALEDPKIVLPQTTQWHVFAAFGTLKGGRADWLVEKCTVSGACSVTPLLTERSPSISENRVGRLQRVNLAAAKQCQRLHEMTLNPPTKIGGLLPIVAQSKLCFVAVAEAAPVISALTSSRKESSGSIIIGPEGDFTEKEMDLIIEAAIGFLIVLTGWVRFFLGSLYLRQSLAFFLDHQSIKLENLVESIKSKVRSLKKSKKKKPYVKMDKSASVKVEIRSRQARNLIDKTLKVADRPGKRTIS